MDPNATLRLLNEALTNDDEDEAFEICENLYDWIYNGGFEPLWEKYPEASAFYAEKYIMGGDND